MTLWTDIEILRFIDAAEKREHGTVGNGLDMLRALAAERGVGLDDSDYKRFLHELFVLHSAGLLTWTLMQSPARVRPITPNEPLDYLNNARDFALTYAGRNQAQGRVVLIPRSESHDDDGRPISRLTLQDVARCIGNEYYTQEAGQLLRESGVSSEHLTFGKNDVFTEVTLVLIALAEGASSERRELRQFAGAWLEGELHTGPSGADRENIEADLARQGWFVRDGLLVIGEPVRRGRNTQAPTPAIDQLHPIVWKAAEARWRTKQLNDAVMAASRAVNAMLQTKVARTDVSEAKLVQEALSVSPRGDGAYRLRFVDIDNKQTRDSMTIGVMNFGVGCFMAIRNPIGHLPDDQHDLTEQEALEQLAAWSLFARWIERAGVSREVVDTPEA